MFLEPPLHAPNAPFSGWLEVISGPMFSGKTEELMRRLKRAEIARQKVGIFKPIIDIRYDESQIVSHDKNSMIAVPVVNASDILEASEGLQVVGIDEAQFFEEEIVEVCNTLANRGTRVIVAGLDKDYLGRPFGPMPELLCVAEYVTKVHAICMRTGELASYSFRIQDSEERILLGEKDRYEARSRRSFYEGLEKRKQTPVKPAK